MDASRRRASKRVPPPPLHQVVSHLESVALVEAATLGSRPQEDRVHAAAVALRKSRSEKSGADPSSAERRADVEIRDVGVALRLPHGIRDLLEETEPDRAA